MAMENGTLLEQIKGVVGEAVKPVVSEAKAAVAALEEKLAAQTGELTAVKVELAQLKAQPARVDAEGRAWERQRGPQAPAIVRELGDRPLMLIDVASYVFHKGKKEFPLLQHVSKELEALGFTRSEAQSILFPLTPYCVPDDSERGDQLRKVLRHAMVIDEDPWMARIIQRQVQMYRKAMDPNDDTLGGSLIPLPPTGDLIELFRAATVMGRVGAEQITLPPGGSIRWPRETGTTTFYWVDSNDTITDSTFGTGALQMTAKRLAGLIKLPNDLLRYGMGAEGIARRVLIADAALAEDIAMLEGEGGGTKPLGILRHGRSANDTPTAGVLTLHNAQTTAANGDTFGIEDPLEMVGLVETAPDAEGANAYIMRPMMFVALANRRIDQGGGANTGAFAFPDARTMGGEVRKQLSGLPVITSTQVNKTSRKGSGTTLTYVLCGNFRRCVVGRVGAVELAASTDAGFAADQTWLRAILRVDFSLKHAESIVLTPTLLES